MDSVGNISGSEVGVTVRVWGCAPSGLQEQSPWSEGQGDEVCLKLMTFHWCTSKPFTFIAMHMQKCSIKKAVVWQNRHIFGGVQ